MGVRPLRSLFALWLALAGSASFAGPVDFHDTGILKTDYACSFHWFADTKGRLVGLDLIRSDGTSSQGLRAFVINSDRSVHAFIKEASNADWEKFSTSKSSSQSEKSFLSRGPNKNGGWLAGRARNPTEGDAVLVSFALKVSPESKGLGSSFWGLIFAHLNATDYLKTTYNGEVEFDGEKFKVEKASGPMSVHFGEKLPPYLYVASLKGEGLFSTVAKENFRVGFDGMTYGYNSEGHLFLTAQNISKGEVDLGGGNKLVLSNIIGFQHKLFALDTLTGTGYAKITNANGQKDLGMVIVEAHGEGFIDALQ